MFEGSAYGGLFSDLAAQQDLTGLRRRYRALEAMLRGGATQVDLEVLQMTAKSEEEAAVDDERFLIALVRAALGRPESEDQAILEDMLEQLEPTPGNEAQGTSQGTPQAAMKSCSLGARPDRDPLGRRLRKPHGPVR